jgi:glycosyltransferase involved in cell wall biosynthesis
MPQSPVTLSVVVPVLNERDNLAPLVAEIRAALGVRGYELIAVDDASTDGSLDELARLRGDEPALRVLALSRRSGQSAALAAGWDAARGEVVVMLDADGQNDPADIPALLDRLNKEPALAAAAGYRTRRRDSSWKRVQSRVANAVRNWLTRDRVRDTGCSLKAVRRNVLGTLPRFDGMHRFLPTLIRLRGGAVAEVPVSHRPRRAGRSKYTAWNRAIPALRDAVGVRWLRRRALRDAGAREIH